MGFQNSLRALSSAVLACTLPWQVVGRQISPPQLRDQYDFVIAGGGTSGLTVADRLTAAFTNKTVLVVEYGVVEYAPGTFDPPDTVWGAPGGQASSWTFNSLPNEEVNNKTAFVKIGKVVGGSSAINGMFFDRGSQHDFDAWARVQAGSPDFDSSPHKWDFNGLFQYFKKAVTFTPPSPEVAQKYGYTWDMSAYGGSTPIYSSFPPFLWADYFTARDAWSEIGIPKNKECASGRKTGLCWVPISEHPTTSRRSHAGLGHFAEVNGPRPNYDLLVGHQVVRIVYPHPGSITSGPPLVEIKSLSDGHLRNVTATAEVIISAGAIHTPTILHRSGIGPASVLKSYGIPVTLDLPGAGSNFHDHSGPGVAWNYTKSTNLHPMPSDMLNTTFAAEAARQFNQTPAQGPYTLAMSNVAIFVSLPDVAAGYSNITTKIRAMAANASQAASYLPPDYKSDPTMIAGYQQQLSTLSSFLENPEAPSLESGFGTGTGARAINLHPLSRGTVRLNASDHLSPPVLDYRIGTNPIDWDVYLAHVKYLRKMIPSAALQQYGAVEITPGIRLQSDADMIDDIKNQMTFSYMHPCCTAAMLPQNKGGVVGPDLKVHGAGGLRVVDMSVIPFLPSSHLSQTAYAVGEKAADIIIQEWTHKS